MIKKLLDFMNSDKGGHFAWTAFAALMFDRFIAPVIQQMIAPVIPMPTSSISATFVLLIALLKEVYDEFKPLPRGATRNSLKEHGLDMLAGCAGGFIAINWNF